MPAPKTASTENAAGQAAAEPNIRQVRFRCAGGCSALPGELHMGPNDVVVMFANEVDAEITFGGRSPFKSGATSISIPNGTAHPEVVASNANGAFPYQVKCKPECTTGGVIANPQMIVP